MIISRPETSLTQTIPEKVEVIEYVIAWVKQLCHGVNSFGAFLLLHATKIN